MTERPKKKQCTCSYDPITNELISAWGCECGADIWNTCIDAWEAWEKENQRIERLDEDSVDDVVFNAYKDLYEPFRKNIVKAICSKFGQPKDAVSVMKIEDIRDELLRLEYKENIGDNEYKKLNPNLIREIIKAILHLIPSNQPVNDMVSVPTVDKIEEIISRWDCSNKAGRLRASFEIVNILNNDIQVSREEVMQILLKKGDIVGTEELADFILTIIPNLNNRNLKGQDNESV